MDTNGETMLHKTEITKRLNSMELNDVTFGLELMNTIDITPQTFQDLLGLPRPIHRFDQLKKALAQMPHGFYIAVWAMLNIAE